MNIRNLNPEELRQFILHHHEKDYTIIDVRQPGEYEQGHIPGARLIPLPTLVHSITTLPTDQQLVFYCHSGGRSMAAATMVSDEGGGSGDIINLNGGMLAWDGGVIGDYPRVQLFVRQSSPSEILKTAMNLEKGAHLFYTCVSEQYSDQAWVDVFSDLAKAEVAHARIVYRLWQEIETTGDDFEAAFHGLPGDVLEGGMEFNTALEKASAISNQACVGLIELALQIEYAAFDLYHTMADRVLGADVREAFITIAQAEKAHMHSLAVALDICT